MKSLAVVATLLCGSAALALPPEVKKALRPTNVLVLRESNLDDVWNLRPGPKQITPDYLILDLRHDKLQSDMIRVVREYVGSGHGLLLSASTECHQAFSDVISVETYEPYRSNRTFSPEKSDNSPVHPILTSVEKVRISFSNTGESCSRCLWSGSFKMILLKRKQTDLGQPLLDAGSVDLDRDDVPRYAAIGYQYGNGRIVLFGQCIHGLPIVANTRYLRDFDNYRFAVNVDQWLAGFPVPGTAQPAAGVSSGQSGGRAADTIVLKNGDVMTGDLKDDAFTIKTSYAEITFKRPEINRITLEGGGANVDVLVLVRGDRLSGMLQNAQVTITLEGGKAVDIARDKIKEIVVAARP
jgi:hypothetical protein